MAKQEFSKYERARIIGARGLQISMDAPLLVNISNEELDRINYDPLRIAERELDSGILPISVNKPMPKRKKESLDNVKVEETPVSDAQKIAAEREITKEISESGDIMQITDPDYEPEVSDVGMEEEYMEELE